MHLRQVLVVLSLLFAFGFVAPARADESAEREQISDTIAQALRNEQFAELEAMAEAYRTTKPRTSAGLWKLSLFYRGLGGVFDRSNSDEKYWSECERLSDAWLEAFPNSPTAQLAHASLLINRAWAIRGTGYADTVNGENWQPFRRVVNEAYDYLTKTKATASVDPNWYASMAEVATFQGWPDDEFDALIDEALDREPLYDDTYFVAVNRYLPKWGGSKEAVERFAREAVKRSAAVEGYGMYARVYWSASAGYYHDEVFAESHVEWSDMKRGFDDIIRRYPDSWNLNHFAKFACIAGDSAKTLELIDRINGQRIEEVWSQEYVDACRAWAKKHPFSAPIE